MALLVTDSILEERLIVERRERGIDQHDEVWEGVYVVSPIANNEHQWLCFRLAAIIQAMLDTELPGRAYPGVNVSDREQDWRENYRVPDVAVFLQGNPAQDRGSHWLGGPDFAVEILSPGDRALLKLEFYSQVGVRELLIVDRDPWQLEVYRAGKTGLAPCGVSTPEQPEWLTSAVLPFMFRLSAGEQRPQIEVMHQQNRQTWLI